MVTLQDFCVKNDLLFKSIFGKEENKDILTAFLKTILTIPEEEYNGLEFRDPNSRVNHIEDKYAILDLKLYTKNMGTINIEMQTKKEENIDKNVFQLGENNGSLRLNSNATFDIVCSSVDMN